MDKIQKSLKEKYKNLHPIVFKRSMEKAKSNGELFDILYDFPKQFPVIWDNSKRKWEHTKDLLQFNTEKQ